MASDAVTGQAVVAVRDRLDDAQVSVSDVERDRRGSGSAGRCWPSTGETPRPGSAGTTPARRCRPASPARRGTGTPRRRPCGDHRRPRSIIRRWVSRNARTSGASWRATTLATLSISMASRTTAGLLDVARGIGDTARWCQCWPAPAALPPPARRRARDGCWRRRDIPAAAPLLEAPPGSPGNVPAARLRSRRPPPPASRCWRCRRGWRPPALRRACLAAPRGSALFAGERPPGRWWSCSHFVTDAACRSLSVMARADVAGGDRSDDGRVFAVPALDRREASLAESSRESSAYRTVNRIRMSINSCSTGFLDCSASAAWNSSFGAAGSGRRSCSARSTARSRSMPASSICSRGTRCRQRLQQQPGIQQVADRGAQVFQIDDDGVGGRGRVGLADQQTAVRTATHARDLVMLDESNGFPQHRSAHPVALLAAPAPNPAIARPASRDG